MSSARSFLAGIIDYAGLFPPASLDMNAAVGAYAEYRHGPDRDLLGRFVVPAVRLTEFATAAEPFLPRSRDPWRLSAIAGTNLATERDLLLQFNCSHWSDSPSGHAVCDAIEIPVGSPADVTRVVDAVPDFFDLFLEVPTSDDPDALIATVATTRAAAKIRTGGVTLDAFPSSADVLRFIRACSRHRVRFKATAGLHHALRGTYPLTYEPGGPAAPMFGYLNLFLTVACCEAGMDDHRLLKILEETEPSAFQFDADGVLWRDQRVTNELLQLTRERLALSFGSCSFREPVDEARTLGLI